MRRALVTLLAALFIATSASPSVADDNLLSVNAGLYLPSENYDDTYDSLGVSLGFSFIRVNEYAGLELGLTSYYLGASSYDTTAIGLEILVHFQKQDYDFQPYIAFGIGVLATDYSYPGGTLSDLGSGIVLKAGARYFFDVNRGGHTEDKDKYFFGVFFKYFANTILDDRIPLNVTDLDVGGQCLCFELGVWTD